MLTNEQKLQNQQNFFELLSHLKVDLTEFSKYLLEVNYFEAPYTAQFGGNYPGGLCEHALKTFSELGTLCQAYFPGRYKEEDAIKVAIFKDIYRAELYELASKNVKNEQTGQWEAQPYYKTSENRSYYGNISFSSYMIARKFFDFTDEQVEAIINSSGFDGNTVDLFAILKTYPLVGLTKMTDIVLNTLGE